MKKGSSRNSLLVFILILLSVSMANTANAFVRINEIMYDPIGSDSFDEWVEIFNNGTSSVDLTNATLCGDPLLKGFINHSDGSTNKNTTFVLQPAGFALITDGSSGTDVYDNFHVDSNALAFHVPGSTMCGILSNSGEVINITLNTESHVVDYTPFVTLFPNTNDQGKTLIFYKGNFTESAFINGTPGANNDQFAPDFNKWINPNENNSFIGGLVNVTVNITDVANVNSVLVNFNNSNFSMNNHQDIWYFEWNTSLNSDGSYNIAVFFNDSFGFSNTDTLFNVSIDNTAPSILGFNSPKDGENITTSDDEGIEDGSRIINVTITDLISINTVSFKIFDSENNNVLNLIPSNEFGDFWNASIVSAPLADGNHTILVFANDTHGNIADPVSIATIIDSTDPLVVVDSNPLNNTNVSGNFNLFVNVVDNVSGVEHVKVQNGTNIHFIIMDLMTGNIFDGNWSAVIDTTLLSDGLTPFEIGKVKDFAGNQPNSESFITVTIDNTKPQTTILSPFNSSTITGNINVKINAKDNVTGVKNVRIQFQNSEIAIDTTLSEGNITDGNWTATLDANTLGFGEIILVANATDFAGNYDDSTFIALFRSELTSSVLDLNETERGNATNVVVEHPIFGSIDFGDNVLNFSNVTKLEDAFNISLGLISVNTDSFPQFKNKSASLVMKELNFTKTPLILVAPGFESKADSVNCSNSVCTNISYDVGNGILEFEVANFSTYFAQTNTTNGAPVITSSPVTTGVENEQYRYDVDATDPDADILTFSLITAPIGMTINSNTGLIIFTPSITGLFNVTVQVSDGNLTDSQTYNLTVIEGPKLRITDLDVKVDGKTDKNLKDGDRIDDEAKPGSEVKFSIKLENFFTDEEDLEIEDIEVKITIEDIDDGDDLEEEADEFDLKAEKDEKVDIEFEIPLDVEEGDFDVVIEVEGQDENGTLHEIASNLVLEVKKEDHEIMIARSSVTPSTVKCQRTVSINAEIINTGSKDEDDATLEVLSLELGISSLTTDIELDEGTDDNRFSRLVTATISDGISPGVYPIIINTYYDGKLSETETVGLTVEECELAREIKEEIKEEKPEIEVIRPEPLIKEKPETPIEISFLETDEYLTLLAILIVIFIGTAIFIIGATFIVLRK